MRSPPPTPQGPPPPGTTPAPAKPRGSALALLFLLGLGQVMLWGWTAFGPIVPRPTIPARFTLLGRSLWGADRDLPIYGVGVIGSVLLIAWLGPRLAALSRPGPGADGPSPRMRALELAGCGIVAVLPWLWQPPPVHLAVAIAALGWVAWRLRGAAPAADAATALPAAPRTTPAARLVGIAWPLAFVLLVVLVPGSWIDTLVSGAAVKDGFHHVDIYVIAPAWAWFKGRGLGADFFSQYGVGWPMVLASLARMTGSFNYTTFARLEVAVGCAYFLGCAVFLHAWLRDRAWAFAGMAAAVLVALFCGNEAGPKWIWPSSTVMRTAADVLLFASLLGHLRTARVRYALAAGASTGLQLLLSNDVGVFLCVSLAAYAACALRSDDPARRRAARRFVPSALAALLAVGFAGLAAAAHGALPNRATWLGMTEALRLYGGGIGHLPVAWPCNGLLEATLLLLVLLATYSWPVGLALRAGLARAVAGDTALAAAIGVQGLCSLVLFVGRSHIDNLTHVAVPMCLLLARVGHAWWPAPAAAVGARAPARRQLGAGVFAASALAMLACVFSISDRYPNMLAVLSGNAERPDARLQTTTAAGDRLYTPDPGFGDSLREVGGALRAASDGGRSTVGVIGYGETRFLIAGDVAPFFRYAPLIACILEASEADQVVRQLDAAGPDWLFVPIVPEVQLLDSDSADVRDALLAVAARHYARVGTAGTFAVLRRASAASGPAPR